MKCFYFTKACLLSCLAFSLVPVYAQDRTCLDRCAPDSIHNLKISEMLVPAAMTGVSALFVGNGWMARQRDCVQDALSARGKHKIKVDEYSQYVPMAAAYGLNLCGLKGQHGFRDRTIILAMSYATMGILVNSMKYSFKEKRPDSNARNSFPSGHTATAFMGAELLYREYRNVSPWIGYAGYAVAAATGYLRIYNDRHYANDVIAGACIGMASARLAYWLYPRCFKKRPCSARFAVAGMPYCSAESGGMNICILF